MPGMEISGIGRQGEVAFLFGQEVQRQHLVQSIQAGEQVFGLRVVDRPGGIGDIEVKQPRVQAQNSCLGIPLNGPQRARS